MANAEISALDFTALSANQVALERLLRARLPKLADDAGLLQPDAGPLKDNQLYFAEAVLVAQSVLALLCTVKAADEMTFAIPGTPGWRLVGGAVKDGILRLQMELGMLALRLDTLDALLQQGQVERDTLDTALMALAEFGLVTPPVGVASKADMAYLMLGEGRARQAQAEAALATGPTAAYQLDDIAKTIFGREFAFPLPVIYDPAIPGALQGKRPFTAPTDGSLLQFLADWGSIRPSVASHGKVMLLIAIGGKAPPLCLDQLCGLGQILADHWLGAPLPADAPNAQPPQVMLLAVAPDMSKRWNAETLIALFDDTLSLTRTRMVSPETLPLVGRILPAIYTQSTSLQGQPSPDWSVVSVDLVSVALVPNLKNFTMVKEK